MCSRSRISRTERLPAGAGRCKEKAISAQISTAIESARLFAAEQQGRIAAAALLEITQIASASLDINRVLNQATNRSAQAIQANRCTILLLDEKEKIKPVIAAKYPILEARKANELLESGQVIGNIVLLSPELL